MSYRIGLDVGITSVGWAVLELTTSNEGKRKPCRIIDLGVRIFEAAEDRGESLASPRRLARSSRRRLRRHRHRIARIKQLMDRRGIMPVPEIEKMYTTANSKRPDVYQLRAEALDRLLNNEEFVRVLIHIAQRRGFKSNRSSELLEGETGKLLKAVRDNWEFLRQSGYRTVGEMLFRDSRFTQKRNKPGDYRHTVGRDLLLEEIRLVFAAQKQFSNPHASQNFLEEYLSIFASQRNFDSGPGGNSRYANLIEGMIGTCTFERSQKRAPKASYAFERFNLLTKLQNMRISHRNEDGTRKSENLSDDQKRLIIDLAHQKQVLTYTNIRKLLKLDENSSFTPLTYGNARARKEVEKSKFVSMPFYHQVKASWQKNGLDMSTLTPERLDEFGWILSVWKSDENRRTKLAALDLSSEEIESLLPIGTGKFGHLSFIALRKLTPLLEQGLDYDKACSSIGYGQSEFLGIEKTNRLPPVSHEQITNPVVLRALSQSVKVINSIIREHGIPESVHIELAREMSKTFDERNQLTKLRNENERTNNKVKLEIANMLGVSKVSPIDIVKFKLYLQQQERCLYSGESFDRSRLFEPGYAEVDHIIPYSISFDDSYNNKVLVKTGENRQKGNRTPVEYLGVDPARLARYIALVDSLHLPRPKKNNLLRDLSKDIVERETFKERNLQDTRYITVELASHIERYLLFDMANSTQIKRVVSVNGPVTAFFRKRWGLRKDRELGDLHHAQDAVIVACVGDDLIQRVSKYDKFKRSYLANPKVFTKSFDKQTNTVRYVDNQTGELFTWDSFDDTHLVLKDNLFPQAWPRFRDELLARLSPDPTYAVHMANISNISKDLMPVFVSRMPNRKCTGPAHKETVKSPRQLSDGVVISKVNLSELRLDGEGEIEGYYNPQDDTVLYAKLRRLLQEANGNAEKAFASPVYKVSKDGKTSTLVNKVKLSEKASYGVMVHQARGVATKPSMVRVDVFIKEGRFYLVPVYVPDIVRGLLPTRAITPGKIYEEWRVIDSSFRFQFSLYHNDVIKVKPKGRTVIKFKDGTERLLGEEIVYYKSTNIANGSIFVKTHDDAGEVKSLGAKTLTIFEKYNVDYLGRLTKVHDESRLEFKLKGR